MKGVELKEKLKTSQYSIAEIARRMGISPQSLNSIFNSDDIKTGVLEKASQVLDIPISHFYGETCSVVGSNNATAINHSTATASDDRLLSLLMQKDEQLTMAMRQTSKAQEQMDKVLEKILG